MTDTTLTPTSISLRGRSRRILLRLAVGGIFTLLLLNEATHDAAVGSISSAYVTVTSFVAGSLFIFYWLELKLNFDFGELLTKHHRWQVPIGALAGATPGCGGAIIIVTQYTAGFDEQTVMLQEDPLGNVVFFIIVN